PVAEILAGIRHCSHTVRPSAPGHSNHLSTRTTPDPALPLLCQQLIPPVLRMLDHVGFINRFEPKTCVPKPQLMLRNETRCFELLVVGYHFIKVFGARIGMIEGELRQYGA